MIKLIVSGGQTGADRAGLDAAIAAGVPHAGWCPAGRRAEDGRIPDHYQLRETPEREYMPRTRRNVVQSDGTVCFLLAGSSKGTQLTINLAHLVNRPCLLVALNSLTDDQAAQLLADFVELTKIETLNVAGSRESKAPGIHARVFAVISKLLSRAGDRPREDG